MKSIKFKTKFGDLIKLKTINGEGLKMVVPQTEVSFSQQDLDKLEQGIHEIRTDFDSVFFKDLQVKITKCSQKIIEEITDERLINLAKWNDLNPPYYKVFTKNLRTELFKRNGLKPAGYKLSREQKQFLYCLGLNSK